MRTLFRLFFLAIGLSTAEAQNAPAPTPGQTAIAYYQICGRIPLNIAALNAMRCTRALEADRRLPRSTLEARDGVLSAVGGYGSLLTVRILSENISGDTAQVTALLYYSKLPPQKQTIAFVKENGAWKVAN